MIDQIRIDSRINEKGKRYESIRLWVVGIPFSADNSKYVEKVIRRFSKEIGLDVLDYRPEASSVDYRASSKILDSSYAKGLNKSDNSFVDWKAWATELEGYLRNKNDYGYPPVWPHVSKNTSGSAPRAHQSVTD